MSGFTSLQDAVAGMGGSIVKRARLAFAPLVMSTIASFIDEDGNVDSNMLAFVAVTLDTAETLLSTLDSDSAANIVMLDASKVRDSEGQAVSFASLKSHVVNTCKSRNVPVAVNIVRNADSTPMGFTVRRVVSQ